MKLASLTLEQCQTVRLWRNDCLETLRTPYPLTEEMQEDFYKNVVCNRSSPHRYWAICLYGKDKQDGLPAEFAAGIDFNAFPFIGMGGITNIQWENRIGEISLIINPTVRGKGYGEKAVELLLDAAFNQMGLNCVFGECYGANQSGLSFWRKTLKRYGGMATTLRSRKFWAGKFHDSVYFDILKEEYDRANHPVK